MMIFTNIYRKSITKTRLGMQNLRVRAFNALSDKVAEMQPRHLQSFPND